MISEKKTLLSPKLAIFDSAGDALAIIKSPPHILGTYNQDKSM